MENLGAFISLFAFAGKVNHEQEKHSEAFCLENRNEEFMDLELERTSEVSAWSPTQGKNSPPQSLSAIQAWLRVPTSQGAWGQHSVWQLWS